MSSSYTCTGAESEGAASFPSSSPSESDDPLSEDFDSGGARSTGTTLLVFSWPFTLAVFVCPQ
jgi:hypothetical protein